MFSTGSLPCSGFHIGSLPWSGAAYMALILSTFVSFCDTPLSAMSSRSLCSSQQGLILVPFVRASTYRIHEFSVVGPRPGTASLFNFVFLIEPCHPCFSHLNIALFKGAGVLSAS